MSTRIALLTEGPLPEEKNALVSRLSNIPGVSSTVLPVDISSETGRQEAEGMLADRKVEIVLAFFAFGFGSHDLLAKSEVPVVVLPSDPNLIMAPADLVAFARSNGVNASLVESIDGAVKRIQAIIAPPLLSGARALIFGEPFKSTTVPSTNLSSDLVLERTGVEVVYRPLETLVQSLVRIDESRAKAESERWVAGATQVVEPSIETITASCKLYLLLKDTVAAEKLSGVSIDCVTYSFSPTPMLPHPCLAFSRLRDEGISAPCEADVCAMVTSLLVERVAQRPSFLGNVAAVSRSESTMTLLHCVAPLKMEGYGAEPVPYRLRDYHGIGRGVVAEMGFTLGKEVTFGSFSKDLRSFVLWPGTIQETGTKFCRNSVKIRIQDADRFLHSIAGCHYVMVYGNYVKGITDVLTRMNVSVTGPMV